MTLPTHLNVMKRQLLILLCVSFLTTTSCIIKNPQPEDCVITTATITKITEGPSYDIVFHDDDASFYINRGLEYGLNLDTLNAKVLNKTVTLHLPKLFYGTTKHIAQLAIGDEIIFTEF
ncbi:hypothetical protein [Psychroserpens sp. SPM9]|uniref:hypothetical protein n=1 Tax=Psychroserpens sp. SPM9 TaxID=2975598 RepID=UPI0021A79A23|nr:hypothetical protein [Psychroserpens sp. SPM9]MDG5490397.1 hypothetical protein [Psychroserpens sp. SPM9]